MRLVAEQPTEIRVLTALKVRRYEGLEDVGTDLIRQLLSAASDRDPEIATRAVEFMSGLGGASGTAALCQAALVDGNERALSVLTKIGHLPLDPSQRAVLLALCGRWDELHTLDLDGVHLRVGYEAASPELRRRLSAAAREAGRAGWVQVAAGGNQLRRLATMTDEDWRDVLAQFEHPGHAVEAWRLAQDAPPLWARELLLMIEDPRALPERDRDEYVQLRELAESCRPECLSVSGGIAPCGELTGHVQGVTCLSLAGNATILASGSSDHTIRLWRVSDASHVATLHTLHGGVSSIAITPNADLIAASSAATITLWRLPDGTCIKTMRSWGPGYGSAPLGMTPDGRLLVSGGGFGHPRVLRLPSGRRASSRAGLGPAEWDIKSLAVAADGNLFATASSGPVRLWSLPTGRYQKKLPIGGGGVPALALASDAGLIAVGRSDGLVSLHRLSDGGNAAVLRGHEGAVTALVVAPHGDCLFSGSLDGTIRLWRLPDGAPVAIATAHDSGVTALQVSTDGGLLASAGGDALVRLWRCEAALLSRRPVAALRNLSAIGHIAEDSSLEDSESPWLDFTLALVNHHRRFDIEVEATVPVQVGEFDIEIGG